MISEEKIFAFIEMLIAEEGITDKIEMCNHIFCEFELNDYKAMSYINKYYEKINIDNGYCENCE